MTDAAQTQHSPQSNAHALVVTEAMETVARREGYGDLIKTTGECPSWIAPGEIVARHLPCGLSERKAEYVTTWHHDFRVRADHPHYQDTQAKTAGNYKERGELVSNALKALHELENWCHHNEAQWSGWGDMTIPEGATRWTEQAKQAQRLVRDMEEPSSAQSKSEGR